MCGDGANILSRIKLNVSLQFYKLIDNRGKILYKANNE